MNDSKEEEKNLQCSKKCLAIQPAIPRAASLGLSDVAARAATQRLRGLPGLALLRSTRAWPSRASQPQWQIARGETARPAQRPGPRPCMRERERAVQSKPGAHPVPRSPATSLPAAARAGTQGHGSPPVRHQGVAARAIRTLPASGAALRAARAGPGEALCQTVFCAPPPPGLSGLGPAPARESARPLLSALRTPAAQLRVP
jgi:hypothetical protein